MEFKDRIPELRSESFEPILFKIFMRLSSDSSLEERVRTFSHLIKLVRPDLSFVKEFFSEFNYTVLQANISESLNITKWTLKIENRIQACFYIGNYNSEEWNLKFVDGNPHFELAKFIATNSAQILSFNFAFLFSALERRHSISLEAKEAALCIAIKFNFVDAINALKYGEPQSDNLENEVKYESLSKRSKRKRERTYDGDIGPENKKRRVEEGNSISVSNVRRFVLLSKQEKKPITLLDENSGLFMHLRDHLSSFKSRPGILEFGKKKSVMSKKLKLPDLSREAVKSYVEVTKRMLRTDNGPRKTAAYHLATIVPENEEEQKELMSQVAQMVCVAIRLKFDEVKLFLVLDWYKVRMGGVWETLLQSGNKFVKEVDDFLNSIIVAETALADDHSLI